MPIPRNQFIDMTSTSTPALLVAAYPSGAGTAAWSRLDLGAFDDTTIFFQILRDAASALTGVTVKLQIASVDVEAEYFDVFSTLQTSGATAIEHTITVGAGLTAFNAISTTNLRDAPFARLMVRSTVANAAAGDRFRSFYVVRRRRDIGEG